jgi:hypothetical protein
VFPGADLLRQRNYSEARITHVPRVLQYLCHRCSCHKCALHAGGAWRVTPRDDFLPPRSCTNIARKSSSCTKLATRFAPAVLDALLPGCPNSERDPRRESPPVQTSFLPATPGEMAGLRRPFGREEATCAQHEIVTFGRCDELYSNREPLHLSARYGESGKSRKCP